MKRKYLSIEKSCHKERRRRRKQWYGTIGLVKRESRRRLQTCRKTLYIPQLAGPSLGERDKSKRTSLLGRVSHIVF